MPYTNILYQENWGVGRTNFVLKNMFGKQFWTPRYGYELLCQSNWCSGEGKKKLRFSSNYLPSIWLPWVCIFPHSHQLSFDSNSVFLVVFSLFVASLRSNFMESINFYAFHTGSSSDPSSWTFSSNRSFWCNLSHGFIFSHDPVFG
jgi:hypothetical protein